MSLSVITAAVPRDAEAAGGFTRGGGEALIGEPRRELSLRVFGGEVRAAREEGSVDLLAGGLVEGGL